MKTIKKNTANPNFLIDNEEVYSGALSCRGCGWALLVRHLASILGEDTVYIVPASCFSIISGPYPLNEIKGTIVHTLFAAASATATGVRAALDRQGKEKTNVVVLAGDGGTFDIGLQSMSGAAARKENIFYLCNNNGAYMNTGVQTSTATPTGALTTTNPKGSLKNTRSKDLMGIVAAHHLPYFATASLAYLDDFREKILKAKNKSGFRFIMVDSPCPPGHKYAPESSIQVSRMAVETRFFPLFESEEGKYRITHFPAKPIPVDECLKIQGRFEHLFKNGRSRLVDNLQEQVNEDWNILLNNTKATPGKGRPAVKPKK